MRNPCTATKSSPCSLQLEKARVQQQRPNAAKNLEKLKKLKKKKLENIHRKEVTLKSDITNLNKETNTTFKSLTADKTQLKRALIQDAA